MKCYKIIDGPESIQRSPGWLAFRRGKITASMIPALMGESIYQTPLGLYESIIYEKSTPDNAGMKRGRDMEEKALAWVNNALDAEYRPEVLQSTLIPDFMASLDGFYEVNGIPYILEIKCAGAVDHAIAISGDVPLHYYGQLQFQMFVSGVSGMQYLSFDGKEGVIVVVTRDFEYRNRMLIAIEDFQRRLLDFDPPPATDRDWKEMSDPVLIAAVHEYEETCDQIKYYEKEKERLRTDIISKLEHPRVRIGDAKISKSTRKGEIDYPALCKHLRELYEFNAEEYRKPSTENWRISF